MIAHLKSIRCLFVVDRKDKGGLNSTKVLKCAFAKKKRLLLIFVDRKDRGGSNSTIWCHITLSAFYPGLGSWDAVTLAILSEFLKTLLWKIA